MNPMNPMYPNDYADEVNPRMPFLSGLKHKYYADSMESDIHGPSPASGWNEQRLPPEEMIRASVSPQAASPETVSEQGASDMGGLVMGGEPQPQRNLEQSYTELKPEQKADERDVYKVMEKSLMSNGVAKHSAQRIMEGIKGNPRVNKNMFMERFSRRDGPVGYSKSQLDQWSKNMIKTHRVRIDPRMQLNSKYGPVTMTGYSSRDMADINRHRFTLPWFKEDYENKIRKAATQRMKQYTKALDSGNQARILAEGRLLEDEGFQPTTMLNELIQAKALTPKQAEKVMEIPAGVRSIIDSVITQHNSQMQDDLAARGITMPADDENLTPEERKQRIARFRQNHRKEYELFIKNTPLLLEYQSHPQYGRLVKMYLNAMPNGLLSAPGDPRDLETEKPKEEKSWFDSIKGMFGGSESEDRKPEDVWKYR